MTASTYEVSHSIKDDTKAEGVPVGSPNRRLSSTDKKDKNSTWIEKRTAYYQIISSGVDALATLSERVSISNIKDKDRLDQAKENIDKIINQLSILVSKNGINLTQLNLLIDIVIDNRNKKVFTAFFKNKIINDLLYCYDLIDFDTFLKIIGCINVKSYNNYQLNNNSISKPLQIRMIKWLLINFNNLNLKNSKKFIKILPLLFNFISFNYLKTIIIKLLSFLMLNLNEIDKNFKISKNFLTTWRLEFLIELFKKNLNDNDYILLLLLFKEHLNKLNNNLKINRLNLSTNSDVLSVYYFKLNNLLLSNSHSDTTTAATTTTTTNTTTGQNNLPLSAFMTGTTSISTSSLNSYITIPLNYFTSSIKSNESNNEILLQIKLNYFKFKDLNPDSKKAQLLKKFKEFNRFDKNIKNFQNINFYLINKFSNKKDEIIDDATESITDNKTIDHKKRKLNNGTSHSRSKLQITFNNLKPFEIISNDIVSLINYNQFINNLENLKLPNSNLAILLYCNNLSVKYTDSINLIPLNFLHLNYLDSNKFDRLSNWFNTIFVRRIKMTKGVSDTLALIDDLKLVDCFNGLLFISKLSLNLPKFLIDLIILIDRKNYKIFKKIHVFEYLELVSLEIWNTISADIFKLFKTIPELFPTLINIILKMFTNWIYNISNRQEKDKDDENKYMMYAKINDIIHTIIKIFTNYSSEYCTSNSIFLKLNFIKLLNFMQSIDFKFLKLKTIILPPALVYEFCFSWNPILIDKLCLHILFCKRYYNSFFSKIDNIKKDKMNYLDNNRNIKESLSSLRNLHNSYVMDLCNIIWRNKSFDKNDSLTAKGFQLPNQFINSLFKQRYYKAIVTKFNSHGLDHRKSDRKSTDAEGNSEIIQGEHKHAIEGHIMDEEVSEKEEEEDDEENTTVTNTESKISSIKKYYNLFHSPSFASITTKIVREFEDNDPNCEIRLAGPLDETEFNKLLENANTGSKKWLNGIEDYDIIRIKVLIKLEESGFDGITGLLCSSLKSLSIKRKELENSF
ncbi:unnamed protein product [[Candida] boidinii]|uniref:Unnamed protein product n=1 Tax=Candida boidinii TaxID=5477 RepID=A0A9W6T2G7_CANBO|nr:unnamed protein product [[Candida] boidinii]